MTPGTHSNPTENAHPGAQVLSFQGRSQRLEDDPGYRALLVGARQLHDEPPRITADDVASDGDERKVDCRRYFQIAESEPDWL